MKLKELINLKFRSIILNDKKASEILFNYSLYKKMKRNKTALGKMMYATMQNEDLYDKSTYDFKKIK